MLDTGPGSILLVSIIWQHHSASSSSIVQKPVPETAVGSILLFLLGRGESASSSSILIESAPDTGSGSIVLVSVMWTRQGRVNGPSPCTYCTGISGWQQNSASSSLTLRRPVPDTGSGSILLVSIRWGGFSLQLIHPSKTSAWHRLRSYPLCFYRVAAILSFQLIYSSKIVA